MGVAPAGKNACFALLAAIGRPHWRKRSSIRANCSGSDLRGTPRKSATAAAVLSSSVGPRPPDTTVISARSIVCAKASAMSGGSSPTEDIPFIEIPTDRNSRAIDSRLVSVMTPLMISLPMVKIHASRVFSILVRLVPIISSSYFHQEGHRQRIDTFHFLFQKGCRVSCRVFPHFEYEFVMYLENHFRGHTAFVERSVNPDHG